MTNKLESWDSMSKESRYGVAIFDCCCEDRLEVVDIVGHCPSIWYDRQSENARSGGAAFLSAARPCSIAICFFVRGDPEDSVKSSLFPRDFQNLENKKNQRPMFRWFTLVSARWKHRPKLRDATIHSNPQRINKVASAFLLKFVDMFGVFTIFAGSSKWLDFLREHFCYLWHSAFIADASINIRGLYYRKRPLVHCGQTLVHLRGCVQLFSSSANYFSAFRSASYFFKLFSFRNSISDH